MGSVYSRHRPRGTAPASPPFLGLLVAELGLDFEGQDLSDLNL
jgi:hypothetical protein